MSRPDSQTKLDTLRQQQLALVQKIKDAEAKAKKKQREDDERRKLLAGAVAIAELQNNPESPFSVTLISLLNEALKRPADRSLFPALPSSPTPVENSEQQASLNDPSHD